MARDLYQTVTDRIIAKLEAGTAPWVQPYSVKGGQNLPCNAVTNRPYSGINVLLYFMSQASGYARPRFLTFNQAKAAGGSVKKGEKGTAVYFFAIKDYKDKKTGEDKKFPLLREYYVFNVAQCEGLSDKIMNGEYIAPLNKDQREYAADAFVKASGADFREGSGKPMYVPSKDVVMMPKWDEFHGHAEFYATAFHELSHWTGHKSRLDRDLNNRFGTKAYAAEELIAELAASFLCAEFGFDTEDNSAAYLTSWLELLKEDKKAIFTAASAAQKAADYLRGKALAEEVTEAELAVAA
jgi:antirestriction protein ArdC